MDQPVGMEPFVAREAESDQPLQAESVGVSSPAQLPRSERYLSLLLLLLISVSFFEGYDEAIVSLVLPALQGSFHVSESILGLSQGLIELGLFFAFFFTRLGDRIGRRRLLIWSVLGYTLTTACTALAWDIWSFTVFQSCSRIFLGTEYAVAITMVVEEFPVEKRGSALGRLLMLNAFGILAVALLLLVGLDTTPLRWRLLYLIGIAPLLLIAYLRRHLQETRRFSASQEAAQQGRRPRVSFWEPWKRPHRRWLVLVGMIHLLRALPLFGSIAWFFYYAQRERGISPDLLYIFFILAFALGMAGYSLCGYSMERFGRRRTAVVYLLGMGSTGLVLYQSHTIVLIGLFLILSVLFGLGSEPLMGALATELFPTFIRNQAAGWARNIFQLAGFLLGPLLVGLLGDHHTGLLGSVGNAESLLLLLVFPAVLLVLWLLPETRGKELEDILVTTSNS